MEARVQLVALPRSSHDMLRLSETTSVLLVSRVLPRLQRPPADGCLQGLDVLPLHVAEVVVIELPPGAGVLRAPGEVLAAFLGHAQPAAGRRRARADQRPVGLHDHRPAADVRLDERAVDDVGARRRPPQAVDAAHVGVVEAVAPNRCRRPRRAELEAAPLRQRRVAAVALERRRAGADDPDVAAAAELALEAQDVERGDRRRQSLRPGLFEVVVDGDVVGGGQRAERADGPVGAEAADQLSAP